MSAEKAAGVWDDANGIKGLLEDGWFPSSVKRLSEVSEDDPCKGALSVEHSHFFTPTGGFGSLDENGAQVDDGMYKLTDDHTFAFGPTKIHYAITGNSVRFRVLIPDPCSRECRNFLPYAIGVFYPGVYHRSD